MPLDIQNIGRRKLRMLINSQDIADLRIPPSNQLEKLTGNLSRFLGKPEKIFMNNPNLMYNLGKDADIGSIRETFFLNQLNHVSTVCAAVCRF